MIQYRHELGKLLDAFDLPRVVAEIGVAESWFTKDILKWNLDKLYLVDAWATLDQSGDGGFPQEWHDENYNRMLERTKGHQHIVTVLRGLTKDMAEHIPDNSLGICYIDALHTKEGCKADIDSYFPKVVKGGVMAFHDYLNSNYGVNQAVKEFCEGKYEIIVVPDEEPNMASCFFIK